MFRQRIRLTYSVGGDKRFLSHHDMMRLWIRALRRSGLPLRMTEGFHVRPRVSFALARGVGIASQAEVLEVELSDWLDPAAAGRALAGLLPDGIDIRAVQVVPPDSRAQVYRIRYDVRLPRAMPIDDRISTLMAAESCVVQRGAGGKRRQVDIRPLIHRIERRDDRLTLDVATGNAGSVRPDEVLAELGLCKDDVARCLVTRAETHLERQ